MKRAYEKPVLIKREKLADATAGVIIVSMVN
jgi:hypothetical protein